MLAVEGFVLGCRDVVALHKLLGEVLAAFQYGTCLGWSDHWDVVGARIVLEVVVNTFYQWVFRTNDYHIDCIFYCEVFESFEVVSLDIYVLADILCTGITWSDKEFLHFLALSDFPC